MIPWVILSALGGDLPHAFALLVLYVIITVIRNIIEPPDRGGHRSACILC